MDKKIITFFLASSINDLEYDRLIVGDFVNQLNNIYDDMGIFIKLYKCESDTLDHSIRVEGSQTSLDDIIKSSDMCFVIFWHKAGEVTFHELKVALEANKQYNKPKIVVYFKKVAEGEKQSDEIREVMRIIDEELLHYHREYSHIDSLKLGIITQLQVHGFVNADISIKDNKVTYANNQIMTVDRIPLFADNAEYTELLARYTNAVKQCEILQSTYAADSGNYKIYRELGKAVKERDRLKNDLDELTENILDIGNSIAAMTSNGKAISDNIRRAIKCFDAGDYDGVLEALDPNDIEKNIAELDAIENNVINERIAIVEEYRMRILALKAQARWSEVHETYLKAIAQVENRPQMPKTVMHEYATFLFEQTQYSKCIDLCIALDGQYSAENSVDKRRRGQIENLCGLAYYEMGNFVKADERLSNSIQIRKKLADENGKLKLEYAESCANLAKVYYYLNRHLEAEKLYNDAYSIYCAAEENDEVRIKKVDVQMSLADLYYQTNRHREAELLFENALGVCVQLSDTHASYEEYVANLSRRLAHINCAILSHRQTDRYFVEALKTRSNLMQGNDEAFTSYLLTVCETLSREYELSGYKEYSAKIKEYCKANDLLPRSKNEFAEIDFSYYDKAIDHTQIEKWSLQSFNIRRNLARQNPEAYESAVAEAGRNLADFYLQIGELDKAEKYLNESMELQRRILIFASESVNAALAATYCSFASLYSKKDEFERAEKMYLLALDAYRTLSYSNELARTYNHLGRLYLQFGKTQESVKSFFDSIVLYLELYRKSPEAYIDRVIKTMANALYSICPQNEKSIMSDVLLAIK